MEAKLKVGPSGSYIIDVEGQTVLKKETLAFPTDQEVVAAVAKALGARSVPGGTG